MLIPLKCNIKRILILTLPQLAKDWLLIFSPITYLYYHWKNLLIRAGFDARRFYQTRHTFACIMLQKGEKLAWVSKIMLGHSEQSTTLRFYANCIPDSNERNAKFLDDFCANSVQDENLSVKSA